MVGNILKYNVGTQLNTFIQAVTPCRPAGLDLSRQVASQLAGQMGVKLCHPSDVDLSRLVIWAGSGGTVVPIGPLRFHNQYVLPSLARDASQIILKGLREVVGCGDAGRFKRYVDAGLMNVDYGAAVAFGLIEPHTLGWLTISFKMALKGDYKVSTGHSSGFSRVLDRLTGCAKRRQDERDRNARISDELLLAINKMDLGLKECREKGSMVRVINSNNDGGDPLSESGADLHLNHVPVFEVEVVNLRTAEIRMRIAGFSESRILEVLRTMHGVKETPEQTAEAKAIPAKAPAGAKIPQARPVAQTPTVEQARGGDLGRAIVLRGRPPLPGKPPQGEKDRRVSLGAGQFMSVPAK